MSKVRALLCVGFAAVVFSSLVYGVTPDRVIGDLNSGGKIALRGNVHALARPEFDLGHADSGRLIQGISLAFRLSAAQHKDLDQFIAQLGDRSSPNYHKYLTPAQFGQRFGMSQNDIHKIAAWLQGQGFRNISVSNSRSQISFDGTIGQIEAAFQVEMRNYLIEGQVHVANATEPLIPTGLSAAMLSVGHLHDFAPRARAKVQPRLTSYVSGNHFLTPDDFATIYGLQALYGAGIDGSGQKIAVVGQSTVSTTDLDNFRSAAGLPASTVTMTLAGGTATKCSGGDEGESDLDIEWAGGVAKKATIIFVYAGLNSGDTCGGNRFNSVWDALQYAVDNNVAPFISTSYGYCESGLGQPFANQVQGWAQQGVAQGQTIVAASGDAGAADCDSGTSATKGLAVDIPAAIPEVIGAGGNEFTGDGQVTVTGTAPNTTAPQDLPYWDASGTGADVISTAMEYIPEEAWNDTAANSQLSASGGGASAFFSKPSWQTGSGVPSDGKRDVPDISASASPDHDSYLTCSEDTVGSATSCSVGFRDGSGGTFSAVGGTSVVAPTFSAVLALINQFLGNVPPAGLAPVNPTLYALAGSGSTGFHDVTAGDNKVPCTSGTTGCPTGTTNIGFSAGPGYDQSTGLGSINASELAYDLAVSNETFSLSSDLSGGTLSVPRGQVSGPVNLTVNSPDGFVITNGSGSTTALPVNYSCSNLPSEATCVFSPPVPSSSTTVSLTIKTTAPTARLQGPAEHGIFYAALLPGLLGIVFSARSRKRSPGGLRLLALMLALGLSALGTVSCGGTNGGGSKDPGTPLGTSTVTVNANAVGAPITASPALTIQLTVTQ